jgi:hypothetical protein
MKDPMLDGFWDRTKPFVTGERVGRKSSSTDNPCFGKVTGRRGGCCGSYKVGVDWQCHDHAGERDCYEFELEHLD